MQLQQLLDSTAANLTASQKQVATLQAQTGQLLQQRQEATAKVSAANIQLQELGSLSPKLAKASSEAEVCRREMSTLSGSQARVHESLQAYLQQEKELRQGLSVAEQHLSRVSQDYAVCQDTSARLQSDMRQNQVTLLFHIIKCASACQVGALLHDPHIETKLVEVMISTSCWLYSGIPAFCRLSGKGP